MKKIYILFGYFLALLLPQTGFSQYCTPVFLTGCTIGDQIESFSTTGGTTNITNNLSGCSPGNYVYNSNMTHSSVPTGTVNFSVTAGSIYMQQFAIFVDWNNDQDFIDPGELVWSTTTSVASTTGQFTIPANAVTGTNLRMRLRSNWSATVTHPCNSQTYGEAEDYNLFLAGSSTNDAGISDIIEPEAGCVGLHPVKVQVENFGVNVINNVTIHWTINSSLQTPFSYNQTLDTAGGLGQSVDTVTVGNINFINNGNYTIRAWTVLPNSVIDTTNYNDTSSATYTGTNYPTMTLGLDTSICPGVPVVLTASSTSPDSVNWSDSTTGNIKSVMTGGLYKATAYKNGCASVDSILVTIHPPAPNVNLGNDTTICYGDVLTLDATTPGVTYTWQDSSTSATYPADTSGFYSVIIEDANTCKSGDTIRIYLFQEPKVTLFVSPGTSFCYGTPFNFIANGLTAGSRMYQLVVNGVNVGLPQVGNTFSSPPIKYGDTVRVDMLTDQCEPGQYAVPSNSLVMLIRPEPKLISALTADTVIENTSKNYALAPIPGSGYLWRVNGGSIVGDSTTFAVKIDWDGPNSNAWVSVTERDASNCSYENILPVNVISIIGISESALISLGKAYPNPASNEITIPVSTEQISDIRLGLYDITGKEVKTIFNGTLSGNRNFVLNVDDLDEGLYFYQLISSEGHQRTEKLVIRR